jgi:hypothetical protein
MKPIYGFALALGSLAPAGLGAADKLPENKLPDAVAKALEKADEVVVYSLDGKDDVKDGWHGANVLGKATVKDADAKRALAAVLAKGVAEGLRGGKCYYPRHGLRATHAGKTYDLAICYQCGWVYVYTDASDKPQLFFTTDASQKALNKILTDAKVELAAPDK